MGTIAAPRSPHRDGQGDGHLLAFAALFLAALILNLRLAGWSPIVWVDTVADEGEVQRCLVGDSCTLLGVSTSVSGQRHAVGWLAWRTLLAWSGLDLDGVHLVLQVANALSLVLVFYVGTRLGGPLSGAVAAWILMSGVTTMARAVALYNTVPLLSLGAVLCLACIAVVLRPGVPSVTLAALVAAVLTNVHLACVLAGGSVVWAALTASRSRFALATYAVFVFAGANLALAPETWLHNIESLLHGPTGHPPGTATSWVNPTRNWMLFGVAAWVLSFVRSDPQARAYRRHCQGALAVIVPVLIPFLVAPLVGLNAEPKYLYHANAATAVAAALPIGLVADRVLRALAPSWSATIERLLPVVVALLLLLPSDRVFTAAQERTPTVDDLATVTKILADHGWDLSRMLRDLKSPHEAAVLTSLPLALPPTSTAGAPEAPDTTAVLLSLPSDAVPETLPRGWHVIRHQGQVVVMLVIMPSRIDSRELELCVRPAGAPDEICETTSWRIEDGRVFIPGMPPPGQAWRGTISITLAIRDTPFESEIVMPRLLSGCAGRIVSPTSATLHVESDGRRALIPAGGRSDIPPAPLKMEWNVGSNECGVLSYHALIPFFVEGEVSTVRVLDAVLQESVR